ncbi:hypothetical protein MPER_12009 [Moniliophthora perniciosa FA553]|nr:hypothetical protein MPER_12009 [Moniliophthora perniciosa FA553]
MHPLYLWYDVSIVVLGRNSAQLPLEPERLWLNRLDHHLHRPFELQGLWRPYLRDSDQAKPDPPRPGEKLSVTVDATVIKTIEDGAYAKVVVKLGLIKLLNKEFDVCKEAYAAFPSLSHSFALTCAPALSDVMQMLLCNAPVDPGDYTVTQTVDLPKEIPKAEYRVEGRGLNVDL